MEKTKKLTPGRIVALVLLLLPLAAGSISDKVKAEAAPNRAMSLS